MRLPGLWLQLDVFVSSTMLRATHDILTLNLGYKINTDKCDCDALNYVAEEGKAYTDSPFSTTNESGMSPCRTKCSQTSGCVGFTVSATDKDNTISCKIFKTMNNKKDDKYTSAFKLQGCEHLLRVSCVLASLTSIL
jgi:hypothetical protein